MLPKPKIDPASRLLALAAARSRGCRRRAPPGRRRRCARWRRGRVSLAPEVRHGLAAHLRQYPDLALATPAQRAAATRLLERARAATRAGVTSKAAKAERVRHAPRASARRATTPSATSTPSTAASAPIGASSTRRRPESLIYATEPGRKPVLIGAMFSVPRGVRGPTPAGPIDRWHSHLVCMRGRQARARAARGRRAARPASRLTQGSEMLHVWFTRDLRSAFAVHAPVPELCRDGLLDAGGVPLRREHAARCNRRGAAGVGRPALSLSSIRCSTSALVRFRPRAILTVIGVVLAVAIVLEVLWVTRSVIIWVLIALFLAMALNPAVEFLVAPRPEARACRRHRLRRRDPRHRRDRRHVRADARARGERPRRRRPGLHRRPHARPRQARLPRARLPDRREGARRRSRRAASAACSGSRTRP